ncbi:Arc family DNA-binding protein [Guyparkeria sp. SB14A]|nr:Arc family DNA-binding protein [Guyparkeria sp. SB14A]
MNTTTKNSTQTESSSHFSVRMPVGLRKQIEEEARREHRSRNQHILMLIEKGRAASQGVRDTA